MKPEILYKITSDKLGKWVKQKLAREPFLLAGATRLNKFPGYDRNYEEHKLFDIDGNEYIHATPKDAEIRKLDFFEWADRPEDFKRLGSGY